MVSASSASETTSSSKYASILFQPTGFLYSSLSVASLYLMLPEGLSAFAPLALGSLNDPSCPRLAALLSASILTLVVWLLDILERIYALMFSPSYSIYQIPYISLTFQSV